MEIGERPPFQTNQTLYSVFSAERMLFKNLGISADPVSSIADDIDFKNREPILERGRSIVSV